MESPSSPSQAQGGFHFRFLHIPSFSTYLISGFFSSSNFIHSFFSCFPANSNSNSVTSIWPSTASNLRWRCWLICLAWPPAILGSPWWYAAAPGISLMLSALRFPISLASLLPLSDLGESERILVLETFRQSIMKWNQGSILESGDDAEDKMKSEMIVVTDACLPGVLSGESCIASRVLINYELPTKKETYMRRMSTCLAPDGIVINVVAGGEVVTLKNVEESCGFLIAEMPINISEIL
ncbi:hypothetical protein LINGRAHAP2_LOCUS30618 [Linum grandiflorum]